MPAIAGLTPRPSRWGFDRYPSPGAPPRPPALRPGERHLTSPWNPAEAANSTVATTGVPTRRAQVPSQVAGAAAGEHEKEPEMSTMTMTPARGGREAPTPAAWLLRGAEMIEAWRSRARSRRALLGLSDAMLKDIGLSRA